MVRRCVSGAVLVTAALCALPPAAAAPQYTIETVAGADAASSLPARETPLGGVEGIAADAAGNLYLADAAGHRVWKVDVAAGTIAVLAGTGTAGFSGDGGPAAAASLSEPYDVAADAGGNVYIADFGNGRIRRVRPDRIIETVAGGGAEMPGAGAEALRVRLRGPRNVTVDASGRLYFSEFGGHRVWAVTPAGSLVLVAGLGIAGYIGEGPAAQTLLNGPAGLAADEARGLYIADSENGRVRRVAAGRIETVIENVPWPVGLGVGGDGALYVTAAASKSILKRTPAGEVTIFSAALPQGTPRDVAVAPGGAVYVAEAKRIWRVDPNGDVRRIAGADAGDMPRPAKEAPLLGPIAVALDAAGDLYIAEEGRKALRKWERAGLLSTVADSGLGDPVAVAVSAAGEVFVADYLGNRVVKLTSRGQVVPVAGTGDAGFAGDNGPALRSRLDRPRGLAIDWLGNLYIADSGNHRVRMVSTNGAITTIAGNGTRGRRGDGGPATSAELDTPAAVAADGDGNLYIAEQGGHAVRKVDRRGVISTVAGTGQPGYSGDGEAAAAARLNAPSGLAADVLGNLLIADTGNHRIRWVGQDGVIHTIAGDGVPGFAGDGGPAAAARLHSPASVAVDPAGSVYVADLENGRIRRLAPLLAPPALEDIAECSVVHGASLRPGPVAPGEIVTIFGTGGGSQVRFDGAPAAVFYRDATQINSLAPETLEPGSAAAVEIFEQGKRRARCRIDVVAAVPGIFTMEGGKGQAAALNEDGTLNSADNPARQGTVLTFFATGEGRAAGDPPKPVLPVAVRVAGLPVEIEYAGAAPGIPGLMQVNVRLPAGLAPTGVLPLELIAGGASSQPGVVIAMR